MAGTDADQRANQAKNDELYRLEAGVKEKFKDSRYIKLNVSDDHYDELIPDNIIDTQDGFILSKQNGKFKRLRLFTIDDYVLNKLLSLHNDYTILSELPIAGGRRATRKRVHINAKKKSNRKIHRRRKSKSSRKSVKRMHRRK